MGIVELNSEAHAIRLELFDAFPQYEEQLRKVRFAWGAGMTRAAGNARSNSGLIKFSKELWTINPPDNFRNTVLHEIAHVIVGWQEQHGPVWVRVAKEIGCTGERYHTLEVPHAYVPCSRCGQPCRVSSRRFANYKRGRQYRHRTCP